MEIEGKKEKGKTSLTSQDFFFSVYNFVNVTKVSFTILFIPLKEIVESSVRKL